MKTWRGPQGKSTSGINTTMPSNKTDSRHLLLFWTVLVLVVPLVESTECYQCQVRQKQSTTLGNCSNTEDDCEGCLEGLKEYSWSPYSFCGPEGITFVEKDKDASLSFGSFAVLWCQFDEPVDCIWQKDDFQVEFSQFVTDTNGTNTTDCSIQIEANWANAGTWDCKSLAEADKDAVNGSRVAITLKATFTEVPQNASVRLGENGTLACHFDMPVSCFWMHNGTRKEISDRIHFVGGSADGQDAADCKIAIAGFRDEDAGEWQCGCEGNSSLVETISAVAWLTKLTENVPDNYETPEWAIMLAVVGSIGAIIVGITIVLACVYGCGGKYTAVRQKEYELGETHGSGRPPVLLSD